MNKRPNSNLSGRLVPIFANSKKKRLKQALYANPTTDDIGDSSTITRSIDAYNESSNSGNEYFETNETSFPSDQRFNSSNGGYYNHSFSSMRGGIANSTTRRGSHIGRNNRGGVQSRMPVKQEPQLLPPRAINATIKNNGSRASHCQAGRGTVIPRNSKMKTEQQDNTSKNRPGSANTNLTVSSQNFKQDQNQTSKERSTKQVNLMATPTDKTLKVITATIQNVLEWKQFEDKMAVIYEIFGTLDSQVSLNPAGNGKNFVIKDKTRSLRTPCRFDQANKKKCDLHFNDILHPDQPQTRETNITQICLTNFHWFSMVWTLIYNDTSTSQIARLLAIVVKMGIYIGEPLCIFWEMDRQLPRLTRGQMHRCVGSLDRKNGNINCVSVRPVKQTELQAVAAFLEASQQVMQEQLAALKED